MAPKRAITFRKRLPWTTRIERIASTYQTGPWAVGGTRFSRGPGKLRNRALA